MTAAFAPSVRFVCPGTFQQGHFPAKAIPSKGSERAPRFYIDFFIECFTSWHTHFCGTPVAEERHWRVALASTTRMLPAVHWNEKVPFK